MTIAHVIIPTLNRYTHLRNCVESLAVCKEALETELIISVDYPPNEKYKDGWEKIVNYVDTISGFKKVIVFKQVRNLGAIGNWRFCTDYCESHYDRYIATEDDNVFAPNFLDYMNRMLDLYKDDTEVMTITGYNHMGCYQQGRYTYYRSKDNGAWGTGYWTKKEDYLSKYLTDDEYFVSALTSYCKAKKILKLYPMLYVMLYYMIENHADWGDVKRTVVNILEGYYQIKPTMSLVRNCGNDGSGVHCGIDDQLARQTISAEVTFDMGYGEGPWDIPGNRKGLYYQCMPEDSAERERLLREAKRLFDENANPWAKIRKNIKIRKFGKWLINASKSFTYCY